MGRHARTVLPDVIHNRLHHLATDLGMSLAALLVEGALLVLRYHDRGAGLPDPKAPVAPKDRQ